MVTYEYLNKYNDANINLFIGDTASKTNHIFIYTYLVEITGFKYSDSLGMKNISDSLLQNNNRLICFFGGYSKPKINYLPNIDIYYIPTSLLHITIDYLNCDHYGTFLKKINPYFDKLYYFLNNQPRKHRCAMMDNLVKHGIYDEKSVSWRNPNPNYNFKYWDQKKIIFDFDNDVYLFPHLRDNKTFENMNSLICLCGETMSDIVNDEMFITEKTYRNLIIGQPFLLVGCINQNNILKDFGFKLYDDIIDYSFDTMENLDDRCENAIIQLKSLHGKDYNEVYKSIQDVVEHNYNRCIELSNHDPFIPDVLLNIYRDHKDIFENNLPIFMKQVIEKNLK